MHEERVIVVARMSCYITTTIKMNSHMAAGLLPLAGSHPCLLGIYRAPSVLHACSMHTTANGTSALLGEQRGSSGWGRLQEPNLRACPQVHHRRVAAY